MRINLLFIGLAFLCGCIECDERLDNATAWLIDLYGSMDSRIDDRNTDLSPAPVSGLKACVTDKMEQGVCIKTSLCTKPEPTVDPTTQFIFRDSDPCVPLQSCCLRNNIRNALSPMLSNVHEQCGFSNPGANAFREPLSKVGFAEFGEFPWMVALLRKENLNDDWEQRYAGGGALIHPSVVITAAHKVDDYEPGELKIRAGEWDRRSEAEEYPYQERDVDKIIIHDNYFKLHAHNNVALLVLKSPVDLSEAPHIGVACLAQDLPAPGTRCYGMGWGRNSLDNDQYSAKLKRLELPLVEAAECERRFKNTKLGSRFTLHRSLTCAGGEEGVDTCDGDGGSPLVCETPGQSGRFLVVGLVTYGLSCGAKLPGAYLKVPEVYDWVGGRLTLEGLNKTSFVYQP